MARRSTTSCASRVGAPCTWQRKPSSAYLSARTTPDFASRRLARTSWVLLPMDETMPIPVTTTRRIVCLLNSASVKPAALACSAGSAACRLHPCFIAEQSDLQVGRAINDRIIGRQPAIGDAEHQFGTHHSLDVDAVYDLFHSRKHLTGKFQLAQPKRTAPPWRAQPAEEKPYELP